MSERTTSTEEPELNRAAGYLYERLKRFAGQNLTASTVRDVMELVHDHKREMRLRGIRFPDLIPLVVPSAGVIELVRRDLEPPAIQTAVLNMLVKYPQVKQYPVEIARALKIAFPHYRPSRFDCEPILTRKPVIFQPAGA